MKVVFAGPSLYGAIIDGRIADMDGLNLRGPAQQGDLTRALAEGARAIGLIDGLFGDVPAVWHKEILAALGAGVPVYGAASMGALRAAECAAFGMIGFGSVYAGYYSGRIVNDDAVAQLHAPAELGYAPLTEALVNVEATLDAWKERSVLTSSSILKLWHAAQTLHFSERTWESIIELADLRGDLAASVDALSSNLKVDVKQADALALVRALNTLEA